MPDGRFHIGSLLYLSINPRTTMELPNIEKNWDTNLFLIRFYLFRGKNALVDSRVYFIIERFALLGVFIMAGSTV